MVAAGIINGVSKDRFDPNAPISREQMAVMIWRAYAYLHYTDEQDANLELLLKFEESGKISGWAKEAVALSLQVRLMQGTSDHHFDPRGQATRAQMAAIAKRLLLKKSGQS